MKKEKRKRGKKGQFTKSIFRLVWFSEASRANPNPIDSRENGAVYLRPQSKTVDFNRWI